MAWRGRGFTLIEMMVVVAIMALVVLIGFPAFLEMLERMKLQNAARESASMLRLTRMEAVKKSLRAGVTMSYADRQLISFADANLNGAFDPASDRVLQRMTLPTGVEMWGPTDADSGGANANFGFPENGSQEGTAIFDSLGAANAAGAFRFKGADLNFLEVRVDPPATGRVTVQKWVGGNPNNEANWLEQGEGGESWEWYEEGETPP